MQDVILPGVSLLSLCEPFADTIFQFLISRINLIIPRAVTKVVVWMKPLTSIITSKPNRQGSFLDIPKIEQCAKTKNVIQEIEQ